MLPVHDLRRAFDNRAFRPAGEGGEGLLSPVEPPSPADEDDEGGDNNVVRNQKIKTLSDECAKHRNNTKVEKDRADAAEAKLASLADQTTTIADLRLHNAFLIAAAGRVNDLDAAWKLADHAAVTVGDDGTVGSFDGVLATLTERYPYLVPDDAPPPFQPLPTVHSGRPNGRPLGGQATSDQILESKFPALKKR